MVSDQGLLLEKMLSFVVVVVLVVALFRSIEKVLQMMEEDGREESV